MKFLVTGAAGFIGYHLSKALLARGDTVIGIDNINAYYDINLKLDRLKELNNTAGHQNFTFLKLDLSNQADIDQLFSNHVFDRVCHLGAQAGVRYSIDNPRAYINSNIVGFMNILENCRQHNVAHLAYASSSSVYGANKVQPFSEQHNVDHPVSLYAATKKSNELMAHTYSSLYQLPTTGLRFFTVYGPWGRPDMAPILFAEGICKGKAIKVFNHGDMSRDFTYIDDIVEGIIRVTDRIPTPNTKWSSSNPDPSSSYAPYKIYNIGNNEPVRLLDFIETMEKAFNKKAIKNMTPIQPGDVPSTYADVSALIADTGFQPTTSLISGITKFASWYANYYKGKQ